MPKAKKSAKKAVKKAVKKAAKKIVKKAKTTKKLKKSKKVAPIPKGYHNITPYLIVDGAMDALTFYKNAFGAKVVMVLEKGEGKIAHAEMQIGDSKFMLADEYPEMNACAPQENIRPPVGMHLYMKDVDAVIERAVSHGATVTRPAANQFYGDRSGGIEDPFGHHWYIATHIEDVSASEMKKRIAKMSECHSECGHEHHE